MHDEFCHSCHRKSLLVSVVPNHLVICKKIILNFIFQPKMEKYLAIFTLYQKIRFLYFQKQVLREIWPSLQRILQWMKSCQKPWWSDPKGLLFVPVQSICKVQKYSRKRRFSKKKSWLEFLVVSKNNLELKYISGDALKHWHSVWKSSKMSHIWIFHAQKLHSSIIMLIFGAKIQKFEFSCQNEQNCIWKFLWFKWDFLSDIQTLRTLWMMLLADHLVSLW